MTTAMKQTDRYRILKEEGMSEAEILKNFKEKKAEMKVFSWEQREIDTLMTPWDSIRYHKNFLRAGFMAMDPLTGHVKAYVGGPDFKFFKYDMVSTGKRQIGSTIKPYLYTLAMEEGMTPCDQVYHGPVTLITETGKSWTPRNPGMGAGGNVSIKWGLQRSSNWVTAYLMKQYSPYAFARLLSSFGLKTPADLVAPLLWDPTKHWYMKWWVPTPRSSTEASGRTYSGNLHRKLYGDEVATFVPQIKRNFQRVFLL